MILCLGVPKNYDSQCPEYNKDFEAFKSKAFADWEYPISDLGRKQLLTNLCKQIRDCCKTNDKCQTYK